MSSEDNLIYRNLKRILTYLWEKELKRTAQFEATFYWFLEKGKERGLLSDEDIKIIIRAFKFREKTAKEIMVPAPEVVCAEVNTPIEDIVKIVVEKGHTRLPIYEGNLDNIIGILHAKNLLRFWLKHGEEKIELKEILLPPLFVPETKKIGALLKEMNAKHMHLAIVIDEYGSTVGIVSLEDIVEEIFGEIQDEYDKESVKIIHLDGNCWRVKANIDIEELGEAIGVKFPEGKYETLAGFLINLTGKVPKPNEVISYNGLEFVITNATPRRVQEVIIKKIPPKKEEPSELQSLSKD